MELLYNTNAFGLLTLIAIRARRTKAFNHLGLTIGQAVIGDFKAVGLSRQQYRTALSKLVEWGFVTIKATNRGTIATITDARIYDINANDSNQQLNQTATIKQPTANHQATTNKNVKKANNDKNEKNKGAFPEGLNVNEFIFAWQEWTKYRIERKKKLTPSTITKQLKMLSKYPVPTAIAAIEKSIESGWIGLFPDRQAKPQTNDEKIAEAERKWGKG